MGVSDQETHNWAEGLVGPEGQDPSLLVGMATEPALIESDELAEPTVAIARDEFLAIGLQSFQAEILSRTWRAFRRGYEKRELAADRLNDEGLSDFQRRWYTQSLDGELKKFEGMFLPDGTASARVIWNLCISRQKYSIPYIGEVAISAAKLITETKLEQAGLSIDQT